MQRLRQWCEDINQLQTDVTYGLVYVDEAGFEHYRPTTFKALTESFREYRG